MINDCLSAMQYIDNLYLSRLLEKSGKSHGISCGLERGHPECPDTPSEA